MDAEAHPFAVPKQSPAKNRASASRRGKKRARSPDEEDEESPDEEEEEEEEEEDDDNEETEDDESEEVEEDQPWKYPVIELFPLDSQTDETMRERGQASGVGGSSSTVPGNISLTPMSTGRQIKKKPRKKQSKTEMLMQMFLKNQEQQTKIQEQNMKMFDNLVTNVIPNTVKQVAKKVVTESLAAYHARPLLAVELTPSQDQSLLYLQSCAHALGSSERQGLQSSAIPADSVVNSIPDARTPDSTGDVEGSGTRAARTGTGGIAAVDEVPPASNPSKVSPSGCSK